MGRLKEEKKVLTKEELDRLADLDRESEIILDKLFENPTDQTLIARLHQNGVEYVRISGEKTLDY